MSRLDRVSSGCALLVILMAALCATSLLSGCIATKASHQNGLVVYVSTSGQVGVGYGETEDLPGGCTYRREVTQISPAFWGSGTNYTHTVTAWDTTAMLTNAVQTATAPSVATPATNRAACACAAVHTPAP